MFNGTSPNLATTLVTAGDETYMWIMAGAKALTALTGHGRGVGL